MNVELTYYNSGNFDDSRVSAIRSREYDIAIDLSGWTGGNFVAGFLARLAPIQVNYLDILHPVDCLPWIIGLVIKHYFLLK